MERRTHANLPAAGAAAGHPTSSLPHSVPSFLIRPSAETGSYYESRMVRILPFRNNQSRQRGRSNVEIPTRNRAFALDPESSDRHEARIRDRRSGICPVKFTEIGSKAVFTVEDYVAGCKPRGHIVYPPTTLAGFENAHNRAGDVSFPQTEAERVCSEAGNRGVATYLDGAQLWNAAVALNASPTNLIADQ